MSSDKKATDNVPAKLHPENQKKEKKFPEGMKVLVVDDDLVCLNIIKNMLDSCNYDVTVCSEATAALTVLHKFKNAFDMMITDVHMPDVDGFRLLELGLEIDLPVIMISSDTKVSTVMKGITHGACDFLNKPLRISELRNIWQHVVRRKGFDNEEIKKICSMEEPVSCKPCIGDAEFNPTRNDINDNAMEFQGKKCVANRNGDADELKDTGLYTSKKQSIALSNELSGKLVNAVNQQEISCSMEESKSNKPFTSDAEFRPTGNDSNDGAMELHRKKHNACEDGNAAEPENNSLSSSKKQRVVWTNELHNKFVNVVNDIGLHRAFPKKILELMNEPNLTREKVASHLQKYRQYMKKRNPLLQNGMTDTFCVSPIDTSQHPDYDIVSLRASDQVPSLHGELRRHSNIASNLRNDSSQPQLSAQSANHPGLVNHHSSLQFASQPFAGMQVPGLRQFSGNNMVPSLATTSVPIHNNIAFPQSSFLNNSSSITSYSGSIGCLEEILGYDSNNLEMPNRCSTLRSRTSSMSLYSNNSCVLGHQDGNICMDRWKGSSVIFPGFHSIQTASENSAICDIGFGGEGTELPSSIAGNDTEYMAIDFTEDINFH